MEKCVWCGSEDNDYINYVDAIGDKHIICRKCNEAYVKNCECRKCGDSVDSLMMINGLCSKCIQADIMKKSKMREKVKMDMGMEVINEVSRRAEGVEFTNEDYEQWLIFGSKFEQGEIMKSIELKRIWIMIKLNATGVYESEVISNNYKDIEAVLDRNFTSLVGNKCKLIIANAPESRKTVREGEVLDYENMVYILKD